MPLLLSLSPPDRNLKNPLRFGRRGFDEAVATEPDGGAEGFDKGEEGGRGGRGGDSPTICPEKPGTLSAAVNAPCRFPWLATFLFSGTQPTVSFTPVKFGVEPAAREAGPLFVLERIFSCACSRVMRLYAGLPGYACVCIPAMFTSLSAFLPLGTFDTLAAASADNDADNPDPRANTELDRRREGDAVLEPVGNATEDGEGEGNGETADRVTVLVELLPVSVVRLSDRGFNKDDDPIPELDPGAKLETRVLELEFNDGGGCCVTALLPPGGSGRGDEAV